MTPELQIIVVFCMFIALLAVGMAIPFAIALPSLIYLLLQGGLPAFKAVGIISWGSLNSFTLTAIPLFIFMAEVLQQSGVTVRVYKGLSTLLAKFPGGLLQTNIAGCALFAAISGSSVATAAAIGKVSLPQLIARNYSRSLSAGSLAAGGTLGILIPPSLVMIAYSSFTETSVARLFMAGVVPGLLLTGMFMLYIAIHALLVPAAAPRDDSRRSWGQIGAALVELVPFVLLIGGTLGSMFAGWVTPTEAAAFGCIAVIVIGNIFGELSWRSIALAMRQTVLMVGNLLFIIYAAYVFAFAISYGGIGEQLTKSLVDLHLSKIEFMFALLVFYTILGCLVESVGMIVITVPLLHPVLVAYGIDLVWFGIVLVLFIEMGQISPPIGINLFVIQSIWTGKLGEVVIGTIPFHILMFVLVGLLILIPDIALWLPNQMTAPR